MLAECLEGAGFALGAVEWLDAPDGAASFTLDIVAEVRRFADRVAVASGSTPTHPIVIPDTAINTLARLSDLEAAAGRPVITANWATLNHGLEMLGLNGLPRRARRSVCALLDALPGARARSRSRS